MHRAGLLFTVALVWGLAAATYAAPAVAQSAAGGIILVQERVEERDRPGIFRFLFRNRRDDDGDRGDRLMRRERQEVKPRRQQRSAPTEQAREEPRPRKKERGSSSRREAKPDKPAKAKPRKQRRSRPAAEAPREVAAVEKAKDAKPVLVVGDFLAGAMAKGLTEAFAQNANVVVVDAHNGESGLVRADVYDWATQIPALVATHKAEAIVVMIGANDRQPIMTEAGSEPLGSDGWRAAYAARVAALAEALRTTTKPVFWVGLGPVKPGVMARDYSAFNNIVREQLEARGLRYVDIWNGFADEEGKYVATGPDVSGQPAQLRTGDGLNFTRAGQRKLAFFVERDLIELLGAAQPELAALEPEQPAILEPAGQPPRIGPMIPIETLSTAAAGALSAGVPAADKGRGAVTASVTERLVGVTPAAAPSGRADNFAWPAPLTAPATTPLPTFGTASTPPARGAAAASALIPPPPPPPPAAP